MFKTCYGAGCDSAELVVSAPPSISRSHLKSSSASVFCRIGYHLATPAIGALARTEAIYKTVKFSDHAPITVEYDFTL